MLDNILGDIKNDVSTHSQVNSFFNYSEFISEIEPKDATFALTDEVWFLAIQEELNQLKRNDT